MKLAILSLGCPKNQVDADRFARALIEAGHVTVPDLAGADAAIINTCGFIQSAKEEAIEEILAACAHKQQNPAFRVIVTGCLAERYREEVAREMPEVDAVVGIGCNDELPALLAELEGLTAASAPGGTQGGTKSGVEAEDAPLQHFGDKAALALSGPRVISTPAHYAWLKIAEGCSNACAYCAIPMIRGPLRCRSMAECLEEARWLAQQGVREVVLVAQDTTAWRGANGEALPDLLDELQKIDGLHWVRMLYAYPERITDDIIDGVRRNSKVLPYFDLPVQHINDEILRSMRRKGGSAAIRAAIARIRAALPEATLRTTLIAGYPGETPEQFEELCEFVKKARFDRLGCFAYSPEEGTAAAKLPGLLPEAERQRRAEAVMELQSAIAAEKQLRMVGKELEVVCDAFDGAEQLWLCRSGADAPEIDGNVLLPAATKLKPGEFYRVKVTNADVYDLYADLL